MPIGSHTRDVVEVLEGSQPLAKYMTTQDVITLRAVGKEIFYWVLTANSRTKWAIDYVCEGGYTTLLTIKDFDRS